MLREFINDEYNIGHDFRFKNLCDHPSDKYLLDIDGHPQPLTHLNYVKCVIEKHLGLTLSNKESDQFITAYWDKIRQYIKTHGNHYSHEDGKQVNAVERKTQKVRNQISRGRYDLWGDDSEGNMEPNILDLLIKFKNWSLKDGKD